MAKPDATSSTARATRTHAGEAVIASSLPYEVVQVDSYRALALMAGCANFESVCDVLPLATGAPNDGVRRLGTRRHCSDPMPPAFRRVRVHDLRHTFGRRLRAEGVGLEDRQDLLGHKSGRMTTHYSAAQIGNLLTAVNRIANSRESPVGTVLRLVG
jgi:hypothetical protein